MDGADNELRYIFVYDELLYRYRSSAAQFDAIHQEDINSLF
jgi:hypothetical protein